MLCAGGWGLGTLLGVSQRLDRTSDELHVAAQFNDRRFRQEWEGNCPAASREQGCGDGIADHGRRLLQSALPVWFARVAKYQGVGVETGGVQNGARQFQEIGPARCNSEQRAGRCWQPSRKRGWDGTNLQREHVGAFRQRLPKGCGAIREHDRNGSVIAFDCERPRHRVFLAPHEIASRPVTNGEWREFIDDDGYDTPTLWLSEGWEWVQREQVSRPLYWSEDGSEFTLGGRREIDWAAPVAHVSYYEADAFARWSGARLPREGEWEDFAAAFDPAIGNQLDRPGAVLPRVGGSFFGDVWEWTQSAFSSHPGFAPAKGAVGEYNGKFMCGQFVLKGASCATPRGHSRASYRNFFPPSARWQFTGVRLARDA